MNLKKTNRDYWEELKRRGWLHSVTKDGEPSTPGQKVIALAYPIVLVLMALITTVIGATLPRERWRVKTLVPCLILSTLVGWGWGAWMVKADPTFPGWLFPPWAATGKELVLSLEDLIFYPLCALFFYVVYRRIGFRGPAVTSRAGQAAVLVTYGLLSAFFLIFTATAGRSEACLFAMPGMLMFWYARGRIDLRKFVVFQVFVILFAGIWDWAAVSWLHYIPGFAWAQDWVYITFDKAGNYHHSNIFLDYGEHRWAWIFDNPIEITPWLGIAGGIFNYGLFSAADRLFYPDAHAPRSNHEGGAV